MSDSNQPNANTSANAVKDLVAGSVGGLAQVISGYPFDTVKVRLQNQVVVPGEIPQFNGALDCTKKTYAAEGLAGFFKGVTSPMAGVAAMNAVLFVAYGQSTRWCTGLFGPGFDARRPFDAFKLGFLAGGLTGVAVSLIECPVDLFKIKLQSQVVPVAGTAAAAAAESSTAAVIYRSAGHAASSIWKSYGVRGVYQGLSATMARNLPANGLYFGVYEAMKRVLTPEGQKPSLGASFVAGGISGFGYWAPIYPIEMIKTRMQADAADPAKRKYATFTRAAAVIYREGGARAFFQGVTPCLLRAFPANAATFLAFEGAKRLLGVE